jgi:hypothetical protein
MNAFIRTAFFSIAAFGAIGAAMAADPPKTVLDPLTIVELTASEVVLPASENGTLVMKACGKCPLKSYPVTAATRYYISRAPSTLAQLSASVAGQPLAFVGVTYSQKTGAIVAVKAVPTRQVAQP